MMVGNLQSLSFQEIRNKIIYAELEPGTKVSEKELEKRMGVGRTPIREALIQLRREKLVYTIPQSGTYVSLIDMKSAENARFARETIEKIVMQECSVNMKKEDQMGLEMLLSQQKTAFEMANHRKYFELDNEFHRTCYQIAEREELWQWLEVTNTHFERYRWLRLQVPKMSWRKITEEHQSLFDAMVKQHLDEISFLATLHLHLAIEEKDLVIQKFSEYFTADSLIESK